METTLWCSFPVVAGQAPEDPSGTSRSLKDELDLDHLADE
jgi:hypothetical protein